MSIRSLSEGFVSFIVAYFTRTVFGVGVLAFILCGGIRVRGYWRAFAAMRRGRLIIIANHPSAMEPFVFFGLFWPWSLYPRFALWSMPDKEKLPSWARWLFGPLRCIAFSRESKKEAGRAALRVRECLENGGTLVLHPEGGRTFKGRDFVSHKQRRMRRIVIQLPRMICAARAQVLPAWIERARGWPFLSIHFEEVRRWEEFEGDPTAANKQLEQSILTAGE